MDDIYKKYSPKQKGWYLGLKQDDTPFTFYVPHLHQTQYVIMIPWEFSTNPNYGHVFDPNTWILTEIDKGNKKVESWQPLKQILPLENCISNNVELEMAYRESLVGKLIKVNNTNYKILDMYHHIYSWTIYNLENQETREPKQIHLQNYNDWSFGGIDTVKVEILHE